MNEYSIDERECRISFKNNDEKVDSRIHWNIHRHKELYAHYGFFHRLMNLMRDMGYAVEKDPVVLKRYKSISYLHWYGRKGDLEFTGELFPRGFRIEFFQNVNIENQNGGRYDFHKWDKMPHYIRVEMIRTMRHVKAFFDSFQFQDTSKPVYVDAENQVKYRFVECYHHPQKNMDFDLHDLDGTIGSEYDSQNRDRDGKEIRNGQIKYTRDFHGYLVCGRVYYDLNMNWVIILNKDRWFVTACWELFDLSDTDVRGRDHPKKTPPKEYKKKMDILHGMKTSWLEKELRRRRRAAHGSA